MKTKKVKFIAAQRNQKDMNGSFGNTAEIYLYYRGTIKQSLKNLVTIKGTQLEIDLSGIHSINNDWIDTFNFLSRLAKKYNSSVRLVGVEKEVLEMIDLIRQYYFFDIQHIKPAC